MNVISRWAMFTMMLGVAGGIGLTIAPYKPSDESQPLTLPASWDAAQPRGAPALRRLPEVANALHREADSETGKERRPLIQQVSHQAAIAAMASTASLGAFQPASVVNIQYTDAAGQTPTRALTENEPVRTRNPAFTVSGTLDSSIDVTDRRVALIVDGVQTMLGADGSLAKLVSQEFPKLEAAFRDLLANDLKFELARQSANSSRRPLDHKKFLDMLIDDLEEKYIELLDGTRAHTANIDNYLKRLTTALDDDFNTQFYFPTFRYVRGMSTAWDVRFGQTETTTILANNREFAKVEPSATMEFDLPKRDILLAEGINGAKAMMADIGALANDPTFLAMAKLQSGASTASPGAGSTGGAGVVRSVLPGLSTSTAEQVMSKNANGGTQFGSNLENLIPDPAIYKFETGTGFEIRPVIQPDGQAVVFDFNYMYTTNIREPVRADEKHLGRVKRHFIDTDVQLSNFELREVSRYQVALKAARTARGVPLFEDIPGVGVLFRPLPSDESSLQQNLILAQATIFPTLFDLMGLRWAPAVADLDPLRLSNTEFVVRSRHRVLQNRVYDEAGSYVDEFLRIPQAERRMDLYRSQETVPNVHPNGYQGPGLNQFDSELEEGYQPHRAYPQDRFIPGESKDGAPYRSGRGAGTHIRTYVETYPPEIVSPGQPTPADAAGKNRVLSTATSSGKAPKTTVGGKRIVTDDPVAHHAVTLPDTLGGTMALRGRRNRCRLLGVKESPVPGLFGHRRDNWKMRSPKTPDRNSPSPFGCGKRPR